MLNQKGQSLISALIAVVVLSIAATALCQLLSAVAIQQIMIQRKQAWVNTKANLIAVLQNPGACSNTVRQLSSLTTTSQNINILNSDGSANLSLNQDLGFRLIVSRIQITALPNTAPALPVTPTYVMGQGTCSGYTQNGSSTNYLKGPNAYGLCPLVKQQDGCSNNYVLDTSYVQPAPATSTTTIKQAKVTVQATNPLGNQVYSTDYFVNVSSTNGTISGCQ